VVAILNPLTEDQAVMRSLMVPGLLTSTQRNISQQTKTSRLFEIGKVFIGKGQTELPDEIEMLAGIWTGSRATATWNLTDTPCDFYDIKGVVESLFTTLKIDRITFTRMRNHDYPFAKPGASAQIMRADAFLGLVGELHSKVLKNYDLKQTAFYFELDLNQLYGMIPESHQAKTISVYPAISRDVTVIIDRDIESNRLLDFIRELNADLVEQLNIFDIFADDPIPAGKKSVSFRIVYRSHDGTLEDSQINDLHKRLSQKVIDQFNAALPE
jgi:phenylalanyl-tRNA synthetase beta chain